MNFRVKISKVENVFDRPQEYYSIKFLCLTYSYQKNVVEYESRSIFKNNIPGLTYAFFPHFLHTGIWFLNTLSEKKVKF